MALVKQLLREMLFDIESERETTLLKKFINYALGYLQIADKNIKIKLLDTRDGLVTTAAYNFMDKIVSVYVKNRSTIDIMRSIAHELVHAKQDIEGRLNIDGSMSDGNTGSEIENEANAIAGILIRNFGKENPEVYE